MKGVYKCTLFRMHACVFSPPFSFLLYPSLYFLSLAASFQLWEQQLLESHLSTSWEFFFFKSLDLVSWFSPPSHLGKNVTFDLQHEIPPSFCDKAYLFIQLYRKNVSLFQAAVIMNTLSVSPEIVFQDLFLYADEDSHGFRLQENCAHVYRGLAKLVGIKACFLAEFLLDFHFDFLLYTHF